MNPRWKVIADGYTNEDLINMARELANSETFAPNSELRTLSMKVTGGSSLVQIISTGVFIAEVLARRLEEAKAQIVGMGLMITQG
jgi:hypothetical protein